jgi:hypothetical protein
MKFLFLATNNQKATVPGYGDVWYDPDGIVNITWQHNTALLLTVQMTINSHCIHQREMYPSRRTNKVHMYGNQLIEQKAYR